MLGHYRIPQTSWGLKEKLSRSSPRQAITRAVRLSVKLMVVSKLRLIAADEGNGGTVEKL